MISVGNKIILDKKLGDKQIIKKTHGSEIIWPLHDTNGLINHFDGINNAGIGHHDNSLVGWRDVVTGHLATIGSGVWHDNNIEFTDKNAIVMFPNQGALLDYTIIITFKINVWNRGIYQHCRLFGERPMHCGYIHSNPGVERQLALFTPNRDVPFTNPICLIPLYTIVQITYRYSAATKLVEAFYNGEKVCEDAGNNPEQFVANRLIGNRPSDMNRVLIGNFYEHLIYNRRMSDEQIEREFIVSKLLYDIPTN